MTDPETISDPSEQPMLELAPPVQVGARRWRIEPAGEIDMSNAPELAAACAALLDGEGVTLEIDLEGLTYLDSSGIGVLVELLRALESREGSLHIVNPSGIVRRVLDLSGLLPLLGDQAS
jgi:anti-sigma B factor antagonist